MTLFAVRGAKVVLTRWNNLAGYSRRIGPVTAFARQDRKVSPDGWYITPRWHEGWKGQIVIQLRPFKVGRQSLYLRISWGYNR
jgi:hypothetical protein